MNLLYLASPYSHESAAVRQGRFKLVCIVAGRLFHKNKHVFSPITHSHPIAVAGGLGLDFALWLNFDLKMLSKCDEFAVLDTLGWKDSQGVKQEYREAQRLQMPTYLCSIWGDLTQVELPLFTE